MESKKNEALLENQGKKLLILFQSGNLSQIIYFRQTGFFPVLFFLNPFFPEPQFFKSRYQGLTVAKFDSICFKNLYRSFIVSMSRTIKIPFLPTCFSLALLVLV